MGGGGDRADPEEREEPRQVPAVRRRRHQAADARAIDLRLPGNAD